MRQHDRPRRLLSLNSYHYRRGGSDVVYLEHDALFRGLGWATAVMSMHHPKNLASPWSEYFVDELEFGQAGGVVDKLVKSSKVIYSFEAQRKLRALLRAFPANIAHLHCIYHHLSPSVLPVLREAGVPTVLTAHDLKIACPAYKMLNRDGVCERCRDGSVLNVVTHRCVRDSLAASVIVSIESGLQRWMNTYRRCIDKVIVPSRFYGRKLAEWGWPESRLVHVPNFVDSERFVPSYEPSDYLLYAGRLAPEKGIATLIRAAVRSGVRLRVAGTGPLEAELRALPGSERVEWLGFCTGDALWQQIAGARALVLPSEWYENAPMSVLEAYACGTPVVGADIGGISEMVDESTGWLFPSGDVDALADVLSRVCCMSDQAISAMGRASRRVVTERFNRARYVEGVLGVYSSLGVAA